MLGKPLRAIVVALVPLVTGCAAEKAMVPPPPRPPGGLTPPGRSALEEARRLETSNGWTKETCAEEIRYFSSPGAVSELGAAALYDAGAVALRCDMRKDAETHFAAALAGDPSYHPARTELALLRFVESKETDVERGIAELSRAVHDSQYRDVRALVSLARLQMKRGSAAADDDGADDLARAEKNLKRALAVDDSSMPAMNQLALLYYTTAKGAKERLDLALLVASHAKRKDPDFAPTYNTIGLIDVALGDSTSAAEAFDRARKLDPSFVEAHMNFAAVNLAFRGFVAAESAYRDVLRARPDEYDAHLGLALALRGQIDDASFERLVALADRELQTAKELDAARPEAYYNDAILTEEYKSKLPGHASETALVDAKKLYGEFVKRAKGNPAFDAAIDDVTAVSTKTDVDCMRPGAKDTPGCKKGRIQNIDEMMEFTRSARPRG